LNEKYSPLNKFLKGNKSLLQAHELLFPHIKSNQQLGEEWNGNCYFSKENLGPLKCTATTKHKSKKSRSPKRELNQCYFNADVSAKVISNRSLVPLKLEECVYDTS